MQIVVNDSLVSYSDTGKGKVLVCVHGWMHSQEAYKQLAAELKGKYRLIMLDLPNFGDSQITDKVESIADFAGFLAAFIKKLDLKNYTLVGHSMGGQIVIHGVASGVLQPDNIVLISSAGVRDTRKKFKVFLKVASKVVRHLVPKALKARFYQAIGSDYSPDLSDIHKHIINKTLTTDIQEDATKISVPAMLIYGSKDISTPAWMGEQLAKRIPHAKLHLIEGEQHWPQQTSADKVAKYIKDFLK